MADERYLGFCTVCMKNITHVHEIHNPVLRIADQLTCRLLRIFRIGYWHCIQCSKTSYHLRNVNRDAPLFKTADDEDNDGSVGNYLKSDHSLLLRSKRAHRYSEKFRDGAVLRLLNGTSTLSQVGRELDVSDVDLLDWIADLLRRKQERIGELEALLVLLAPGQKLLDDQTLPTSCETPVSYSTDDTIDGQVT